MKVAGTQIRPPAVPLAVRDPYASTWLFGTDLTATGATGWNGAPMSVCGLARIDGHCHVWCGDWSQPGIEPMRQRALEVTPTRTIFLFEAGGVGLVAEWLSPVEPGDPRLQSVPLSLVSVEVQSLDARSHAVQVYCEISGEWASFDPADEIVWHTSRTRGRHLVVQLAEQQPLSEHNEMAAWGSAVISTLASGAESYEVGGAQAVRQAFASVGRLADTLDARFRAIGDNSPSFALARDLGSVAAEGATAHFSLGRFERPQALEYLGEPLPPYWSAHFESWQEMADEFLRGAGAARRRAAVLDDHVTGAATAAGGAGCAVLCALSLRQAYGACQLVVGPRGRPWAFLKEISSDEDISTVDIVFASCPVWLDLDPGFLAALLEPVLDYAASDKWTEPFPPHGLGTWPVANGNPLGAASEPMPMQEAGGMLVMAAAYARRDPAGARPFLARYEKLWARWAELLVSQLPDPPDQLTTVDYFGPSKGNVNLAALGIVGLGAASQIANHLGQDAAARRWHGLAKGFAARWATLAMDRSGRHLDIDIGSQGTWSTLCNAYWDRALKTDLLPESVRRVESAWYRSHVGAYGMPLKSTWPTLSRVDKLAWTAAWLHGEPTSPKLIDALARYVGHTSLRAPLPDNYDPVSGGPGIRYNWQARPVVGGVFALLGLD